jgi:hypothetical protein
MMKEPEWELTFDGKNTSAIQALVGRMQNMDGDVDQVRYRPFSESTPELGGYVWVEDEPDPYFPDNRDARGGWVDVEVGDTISKIGSMWVPKYGNSPVFRVTKGE